jgi:hypothetical protein
MIRRDTAVPLTVICARAEAAPDPAGQQPGLGSVLAALGDEQIHWVGRRPGKEIDHLLSGRILVIGDDTDLAAVASRLQRRELLADVVVAYAPVRRTAVADLWSLPVGARAVPLARHGDPDLVPFLRDDNGGVLVGEATIGPLRGPVYIDEFRLLNGPARGLIVQPDAAKGLTVTLIHRRFGMLGRRSVTQQGRAVQIGTTPATLIADGRERDRQVERWTYYKHTEPMRLVRGVVD